MPAAGILGGVKKNDSPANVEKRTRVLQILQDNRHRHISSNVVARRLTAQGIPCNGKYVQRLRAAPCVTVPFGSGGARRSAISDVSKRLFIASVVGEVDENNYRYGGTSLRVAVRRWNADDDNKEQVTLSSAQRWIAAAGYTGRVPQTGPFIKVRNVQQRKTFVDKHWRHSPNWWNNICFTDSTQVASEHVPNAHNEQQYCLKGEHPRPLRKKNRPAYTVHVYGACTKWGMVGPIFVPQGTNVNQYNYTSTILPALLKGIADIYAANNDKSRWTFQQDGASPHRSDRCQLFLGTQERLRWWARDDWPGSSPDLSPIEGMWSLLQDFVTPPDCMGLPRAECISKIEAWFRIDNSQVCRAALRGMPHRLHKCRAAGHKAFRK